MPLVTLPALAAQGMTAAQMAAAAAAAAQTATAATAATTAAATAAPTIAATTAAAPTLAATTAGSVAPGAFGAGITGAGGTGAGLTAGGAGAGGAGITAGGAGSAAPGAFVSGAGAGAGGTGAGGVAPGAFGAGTGGAGAVPSAETLTASTGEGIMTDAGMKSASAQIGPEIASNPAGEAQIQQLLQNGTPPFANNPTGDPNVANAITNPPPASGMPPVQPAPPEPPFAQNPYGMVPKPPAPTMAETNASILKSPTMEFGTGDISPGIGNSPQPTPTATGNALERGIKSAVQFAKDNPYTMAAGSAAANYLMRPEPPEKKKYAKRDLSGFQRTEPSTSEYTPIYEPQAYAASGGLMSYAVGGPVEQMSAMNAVGGNQMYPMANLQTPMYSNPMMQRPQATNVIAPSADAGVNTYTGEPRFAEGGDVPAVEKLEARNRKLLGIKTPQEIEEDFERGQDVMRREGFGIVTDSDVDTRRKSPAAAAITQLKKIGKRTGASVSDMPKSEIIDTDVFHAARGGITYGLGGYSDGGRLLRGPGDGVSDSIPASIGNRQPARLADGEFVVPARIVSELGNGSTEAGARKLYAMMERVQASRKKSIGKKKVAVNSKADKHLPA